MSYISFWGARGGRTRPKICCMSIYQIGWADCKKPYGTSKNYFQVTLSKSTASFNKKQKSTIEHRKWAKMTYIWFWVYWLAEYAHKSVKYRSTKFGGLTGRDPNERAKAISQLIFLTRRRVLEKPEEHYPTANTGENGLYLILGALVDQQSRPQNLIDIDLPNLVCWLEEILRK